MAVLARESWGLRVSCGIFFNHESPRRGKNFVTRKITSAAAEIAAGLRDALELGDTSARRDWGYAPDYVECAWLAARRDEPGDYVIGTGETHAVREFLERAFESAGLDWRRYVKTDPALFRPQEGGERRADASKARRELGWTPKIGFEELVGIMVKSDMDLLKKK
jgi:GDPmannose 4,6-dehydratase